MRVMVLVKATEDSEAKEFVADAEGLAMLEAMGRFNDELRAAGILREADGLKPSSHGKRIAFDGDARRVIDGPFLHASELVAGYWIWEVKDMDEAVAWGKRCPNPMPGPSEIEIRPFYELADLRPDADAAADASPAPLPVDPLAVVPLPVDPLPADSLPADPARSGGGAS